MTAAAHRSNFILKEKGVKQLEELHGITGHSKGQIVRDLIDAAHKMKCQGIPQCANAQPCPYPQAHAQVQQFAPRPTVLANKQPSPTQSDQGAGPPWVPPEQTR